MHGSMGMKTEKEMLISHSSGKSGYRRTSSLDDWEQSEL